MRNQLAEGSAVALQVVRRAVSERDAAMAKYAAEAMDRRRMQLKMQDHFGTIRVVGRIRPALRGELPPSLGAQLDAAETSRDPVALERAHAAVRVWQEGWASMSKDGNQSVVMPEAPEAGGRPQPARSYSLDYVFGPDSTQSGVFDEIGGLVQKAMEGVQCCIFACECGAGPVRAGGQ